MSESTRLYGLSFPELEKLDRAEIVSDSNLAALNNHHHVDQGLASLINDYPDVFAYVLKPEGRIPQEHEEVRIGYVTPRKLKERLQDLDGLALDAIEKEIGLENWDRGYVENNLVIYAHSTHQSTRETYEI
jgi:hypothetical protein